MSERQLSESERVVVQRALEIVSSLNGDGRVELGSSSTTPTMERSCRNSQEGGSGESTGSQVTPRATYMTTPRLPSPDVEQQVSSLSNM